MTTAGNFTVGCECWVAVAPMRFASGITYVQSVVTKVGRRYVTARVSTRRDVEFDMTYWHEMHGMEQRGERNDYRLMTSVQVQWAKLREASGKAVRELNDLSHMMKLDVWAMQEIVDLYARVRSANEAKEAAEKSTSG